MLTPLMRLFYDMSNMNGRFYNPNHLVKARQGLKKSQTEVALALSVTKQTIYRVETGQNVSMELLAALCEYYKLPLRQVLYDSPLAQNA